MSETRVVKEVRVEASLKGARLFRNNVGKLPDQNGRWVEFGLCPGSSDLIGWDRVLITPEMVGTYLAQFLAVEAKDYDGMDEMAQRDFLLRNTDSKSKNARHIREQLAFIDTVRRNGGRAGIALNKEQLSLILSR